jgi:tetratricopeptide (TPR) repeat protein
MERRGAMKLWLLLLAGCQSQSMNVPRPGPLSASVAPQQAINPALIKKAPGKPKDLPPQVLTSSADFRVGEAANPKKTPEEAQLIREQARLDYEKAIKLNPKYVPAYQGLARLYNAMNERERVVETYQRALQIDGKNAVLWYELAMYYNGQKNWNSALDCVTRALKFDPRNRNYLNAQAIVLAEAGRYDESLNCFVHSSGEAMGSYRLAQTLDRLQQPGLSRYYLETALHKDPSLASTMNVNPPVEQTAYQSVVASVPPTPPAPSSSPDAATSETPTPTPQVILLPPPPTGG